MNVVFKYKSPRDSLSPSRKATPEAAFRGAIHADAAERPEVLKSYYYSSYVIVMIIVVVIIIVVTVMIIVVIISVLLWNIPSGYA